MRQAARTARYDQALGLEAYSLRAVDRPFPSHFHDHYVIGVVERTHAKMQCIFQRRMMPVAIAVKQAVAEGRFGRICLAGADLKYYRDQAYYNSAGWRGGKKVFFPASFSDIVYNETIILSLCKGEYP